IIQKGDSLSIYSDTLRYNSETRMSTLSGEVALQHHQDQLWTSHLTYDLGNDLAYYDRSGILVNDSTQIASRIGFYWVRDDVAKFVDSVVVIGDEVTLLADSLLYNVQTQRADFLGPTWIIQEGARIYCEAGYYDVDQRVAEFRENASYTNEDQSAMADTIRYEYARNLVDLIGNAHFEEGDRIVDSDRIRYFENSGITLITGDAWFRDSLRSVRSERIMYNRKTEDLQTTGRSVLTEGPQVLEADSIDFNEATGLGDVRGRVVFTDTAAQTVIESDRAWFDRNTEFVKAFGSTRALLKSLVDEDTMYMTADTFIFEKYVDTVRMDSIHVSGEGGDTIGIMQPVPVGTGDTLQRFEGYPDVRIFHGTMQSLCRHITFDAADSTFHLRGAPIMWSDTSQFTADSIDIAMQNKAIDKVYLHSNAFIVNIVEGELYNQIKGRNMVASFVDDELRHLKVTGNAESIYYVRDDDQSYVGVNRVASSEIFFTFVNRSLDQIRFYTTPTGKMMPMDAVNHRAIRLEGFVWKEDIRPKSREDLF
ncbi:MAG: OstA-like protein, partial [Saprospiraceae bacterium]|nr:OstA-like protein [Saprospiraceae bacterium]